MLHLEFIDVLHVGNQKKLLTGNPCVSLSCGSFSSESLFMKPSSDSEQVWDGHVPGTQCGLNHSVVMSSTAFLFRRCSFHLLSTILCADHINVLGREQSQKKSQERNKQLLTQRQICSLPLEVQGGSSAEPVQRRLPKESETLFPPTRDKGGCYLSQKPFPHTGSEQKRLKFFPGQHIRAVFIYLAQIPKMLLLRKNNPMLFHPFLELTLKKLTWFQKILLDREYLINQSKQANFKGPYFLQQKCCITPQLLEIVPVIV